MGEVVERDRLLEIPVVSEQIGRTIKELILQKGLGVTEDQLGGLENDYNRQSRLIGTDFRNKGQETGILSSMTTGEALQRFGQELAELVKTAKMMDGWFIYRYQEIVPVAKPWYSRWRKGQEAVQTQDRDIIVIPQQDDGNNQLDIIDLDQLYKKDPVFVKESIVNSYRLEILRYHIRTIIGLVKDNYSYHELDEQSFLPDLLQV